MNDVMFLFKPGKTWF